MVALARQKSDLLEDALQHLSDLLLYTTCLSLAPQVTLQQEADFLKAYVELQKLRFSDSVRIDLHTSLDTETIVLPIEPMLLMRFVESVFNSSATSLDEPFIHIRLGSTHATLTLIIENSYDPNPYNARDGNPGLGLGNMQKWLEEIYPGKHSLILGDHGNTFRTTLNLQLQ